MSAGRSRYGEEKGGPHRNLSREVFTSQDKAEFDATVAADPPQDAQAMADDEWLRHMMGKYGEGGI